MTTSLNSTSPDQVGGDAEGWLRDYVVAGHLQRGGEKQCPKACIRHRQESLRRSVAN